MIDELRVRDVALIRDAVIEPAPGLTVLTGETGAGKTALLSSIKLLVGERADAGMVREGASSLEVEGRLFLPGDDEDGTVVRRRVGADVAFFLDPRPALYVGAGDVFDRAFPAIELPLALVMPIADGGSTVEAYAAFDRKPIAPAGPEPLCAALAAGDVEAVTTLLHNNLAPAARSLCPEVGEVESWLRSRPGVLAAQVTGSGSCSFAVCESQAAALAVAEAARRRPSWRAWATRTWNGEDNLLESSVATGCGSAW